MEPQANAPQRPTEQKTEAAENPIRVCVIDLGTNSFHALIVDAFPNGTFQIIDKIKEVVQLGAHGLAQGLLTEDAVGRALDALRRIHLLAEGWEVEDYLAFATSAIREADNGGDFIEYVRDEVGLVIRPISGEQEAHLIYQGIRRAVDLPEPALLVDIGGGSTEFIVGTSQEAFFETSLKVGAARMTERFVTTDPISKDERQALQAHYESLLAPVFEAVGAQGARELIGSSGTMENLAEVCLRAHGDTSRSIFQQAFSAEAFREVTQTVIGSTREERAAMDGIDEKRVGQVVAGAVLVDFLIEKLEIERVRLSPNALREGMVVHFIEQNYDRLRRLAPLGDVRRRGVYELAARFAWEERHARKVARLALQLFDACQRLHELGPEARELLEYAALLHDIGYVVNRRKHYKHGRYLIEQAEWHGFQPEEVAIMANVVRYHAGALPKKKKHKPYKKLSKSDRKVVDRLASLLRLAEGLDRSHYGNVTQLRTDIDDEHLRLTIQTKGDPAIELWGARRSSDLFERTFERSVQVSAAWARR